MHEAESKRCEMGGVANRRKMIRAAQMISQCYAAKTKDVRSLAPLFEGGNESV